MDIRVVHSAPPATALQVPDFPLDCFRLDYNISIGEGGESQRGGYTENVLWRFYPCGLDVSRRYRVTYDTAGRSREVHGGHLVDKGLRVPVRGAYTSELLLFEAL